ncbi:hypothetical protein RHSIM_Rhsim07G0173900 [Rhododendron simsii]|uniref:Chorismate-utilising enzyme C-terminal domain-containing protein n=1 Tax=Rhododendron simsii TaxID=118357 RepID=A0A834GND5_RHOSS|nr:hypothetical protein RHSIM_Rhsim07G0173900 [Rhododendron simsii]
MEIVAYKNMVMVMDYREGGRTKGFVEDPMVVPQRIMQKWKPQRLDELPEAFCGGWVFMMRSSCGEESTCDALGILRSIFFRWRGFKDGMHLRDTLVSRVLDTVLLRTAILVELCTSPFGSSLKKSTMTSEAYKEAVRGKILEEDYMLEKQLLHDEKQCTEHIMLVDLARNDVAKGLKTWYWMLISSGTLNNILMSCSTSVPRLLESCLII